MKATTPALQASLLLALFQAATGSKLVVATEKGLWRWDATTGVRYEAKFKEAMNVNGRMTAAMTVDRVSGRIFYSHHVSTQNVTMVQQMYDRGDLKLKQGEKKKMAIHSTVRGLAYDEETSTLYWTNMVDPSIWRCQLNGADCTEELFITLKGQDPAAISIHEGHLYWTDNNHTSPSINRIHIWEQKSSVIVRDGLFMPNGIAVDPSGRGRIYWTDDSEGDAYKIESADTDGGNRRTELRGFYQSPMDLAFSPPTPEAPKGALYWSDWANDAVWTLDLDATDRTPRRLPTLNGHLPMGLVVLQATDSA
ncbi:protein cueball-like [Hetaerina americana]|uniref:protein cueball-like n=1 Tax=Hetaerina americana TaxID=62018 RepID=UPI003A7F389D